MVQRDVIVVGASAGGVEALIALLAPLPADFPACLLVILHTPSSGVNALAAILGRSTELQVVPAEGETPLRRGTVIVAHPDHHLLVVDGQAILTHGPRENGHRPAIDVLFRSAARVLGPRVIGVVLSGALDDGSVGLVAIRDQGGVAVVQDPRDAAQPGMPLHAIAAVGPRFVLPVAALPAVLRDLVGVEVDEAPDPGPEGTDQEMVSLRPVPGHGPGPQRPDGAGPFACPECHRPLQAAGNVRYRCDLGHDWSLPNLLAADAAALEGALWLGLRSLEEKATLAHSMSERAQQQGQALAAERFTEQASEAHTAAGLIRRMLLPATSAAAAPAIAAVPPIGQTA